jgi:putative transcriptional regulator
MRVETLMIEIRVDQLLAEHGRTFYWLAKETGISHTTLWRLKKGKALGINFETLEKMCQALKCQPGDVLALANGKPAMKVAKKGTLNQRARKKQR